MPVICGVSLTLRTAREKLNLQTKNYISVNSSSKGKCKEKVGREVFLHSSGSAFRMYCSYCSALNFRVYLEWKFCPCI